MSSQRVSAISERFAEGVDLPWPILAAAVGLVVVLLTARWVNAHWARADDGNSPRGAFADLASQLQLTRTERRLLRRVARRQRLSGPMVLLVCATTFEHHARAYLHSLSAHRQPHPRQALQALRDKLFVRQAA